ncbi:MAG: hypothetical protein ABR958_04075 [Dehalococcoidales bacterium]
MLKDSATDNQRILSEPLRETSGYCSNCHSVVLFIPDKERGYYKRCPNCGHAEHLTRRPLRFDRKSRQWL